MKFIEDPKLYNLDCGDNSCKYKSTSGGMRTNGGCRCAQNHPRDVERFLLRNFAMAQARIQELEKSSNATT